MTNTGVIDLGLMPGRMGRKQIGQHVQGMAVAAGYDRRAKVAAQPASSLTRKALQDRIESGSAIAHPAGGAVVAAEQIKDA